MGYGWSKSFARLVTYQDAADVYGKGGFNLIDTLFSSSALAGLDPGIATFGLLGLIRRRFAALQFERVWRLQGRYDFMGHHENRWCFDW